MTRSAAQDRVATVSYLLIGLLALVVGIVVYDVTQKRHAILRNFPVIGHFRYLLESVGPELRQYIVTSNDEEMPFSRDQRSWVYTSSKKRNNYFGFGTDNDLSRSPNYLIIRQSAFPRASLHPGQPGHDPDYRIECAKVLGGRAGREHAFRPSSIVNTSAMSFGSLSWAAVEAMNRGVAIAGCLQNTGEGGVAPHHLHGGDLIWQIGTGYFGCRAEDGGFSRERFLETLDKGPIRAIEIKMSQGAKPGLGGVLPARKVTSEIASIRGIPVGKSCISPSHHTAFHDADSLLDFAESLAADSGLPVGIKSAVGDLSFWYELTDLLAQGDRRLDFVTIDGGEGGTGAAPLVFSDHVSLPFIQGFSSVHQIFAERQLTDEIVFIGSGKLGFPQQALLAMAMGCDMIAVAREAMLAIGCIQAQRCHTDHCPTGVATHSKWLVRGLDPESKAARLANYIITLRKEVLQLTRACGFDHPSEIGLERFTILDDHLGHRPAAEVFAAAAQD